MENNMTEAMYIANTIQETTLGLGGIVLVAFLLYGFYRILMDA